MVIPLNNGLVDVARILPKSVDVYSNNKPTEFFNETISNKHLESIFPFDYQTIEGGYLDISSTNVRKIINTESNLENFIPNEIIKFIKKNSLYSL